MERNENELMEDDDDSDGVTEEDLKRCLKDVRSKKAHFKMQH
jgi:hypothetical protein